MLLKMMVECLLEWFVVGNGVTGGLEGVEGVFGGVEDVGRICYGMVLWLVMELLVVSKVVRVYLVVLKMMVELQVLMMELMVGHKLKN